jgi:Ala-tRNA(Pro) deacylase
MTPADPAELYTTLDALGVRYECHEHPPVFTVEEALTHWADIEAAHCKNLFLRNKKGTRHYLVVVEHRKSVDLAKLAVAIGDDRLSFGSPERLAKYLGLTPGAVSPFGLINDRQHEVLVILDDDLRDRPRIAFHPNVNTATLVVSFADFERFLTACGNVVRYVRI